MPVVIRWNPTYNAFASEEAMNHMLDTLSDCLSGRKKDANSAWAPVADVSETDNSFVITIELVDIDKNSLEMFYEDGYLLVQGTRPFSADMQYVTIHRIERMYGHFRRVFWIPGQIDSQQISATYQRGVLRIVMLKLREEPVKVPVTATL